MKLLTTICFTILYFKSISQDSTTFTYLINTGFKSDFRFFSSGSSSNNLKNDTVRSSLLFQNIKWYLDSYRQIQHIYETKPTKGLKSEPIDLNRALRLGTVRLKNIPSNPFNLMSLYLKNIDDDSKKKDILSFLLMLGDQAFIKNDFELHRAKQKIMSIINSSSLSTDSIFTLYVDHSYANTYAASNIIKYDFENKKIYFDLSYNVANQYLPTEEGSESNAKLYSYEFKEKFKELKLRDDKDSRNIEYIYLNFENNNSTAKDSLLCNKDLAKGIIENLKYHKILKEINYKIKSMNLEKDNYSDCYILNFNCEVIDFKWVLMTQLPIRFM